MGIAPNPSTVSANLFSAAIHSDTICLHATNILKLERLGIVQHGCRYGRYQRTLIRYQRGGSILYAKMTTK